VIPTIQSQYASPNLNQPRLSHVPGGVYSTSFFEGNWSQGSTPSSFASRLRCILPKALWESHPRSPPDGNLKVSEPFGNEFTNLLLGCSALWRKTTAAATSSPSSSLGTAKVTACSTAGWFMTAWSTSWGAIFHHLD